MGSTDPALDSNNEWEKINQKMAQQEAYIAKLANDLARERAHNPTYNNSDSDNEDSPRPSASCPKTSKDMADFYTSLNDEVYTYPAVSYIPSLPSPCWGYLPPPAPIPTMMEEELWEDLDPKTDPLPQPLADTLEKWFHKQYTSKEIVETIAQCCCPQNCDALKVIEINKEVKKHIKHKNHQKDERLRQLCTAIQKSTQPLATTCASLLELEHLIKSEHSDEEATISFPTKDINI